MDWLKENIKKFGGDALVIVGLFLFSISFFREVDIICFDLNFTDCTHPNWTIIVSAMFVAIGVDIFIRNVIKK